MLCLKKNCIPSDVHLIPHLLIFIPPWLAYKQLLLYNMKFVPFILTGLTSFTVLALEP